MRRIIAALDEKFPDREIVVSLIRQLTWTHFIALRVIKPCIMGKDIRKWTIAHQDKWMIYMPHGINVKNLEPVLDYLRQFKDQLEDRATKQNWFELQQPQERYTPSFAKPKIVFPDISSEVRFAFDASGSYPANTAYGIGSRDSYLLGILNSAVVGFFTLM